MTDQEILETEILLPYQQKWGRDESQVKVWEKSRRIGASYAEACVSVLEAAKDKKQGGQSTYYLSYNKEMTRQFISDCAMWAKLLNKACGQMEEEILTDEDKDITVFRITFASGFQIWGLPSEPRSLRSKQGRVVIDEAGFVESLKELLKAAFALLMWGGSVSVLSTHNGEENDFNEMIKDIRDGKLDYSLHRTTIQDALDQGLFKRICLRTGRQWTAKKEKEWLEKLLADYGDGAAEELYCIPTRGGDRYISRTLVESCMDDEIPVLKYECTDEFTFKSERHRKKKTEKWIKEDLESIIQNAPAKPTYFGMDFARSGDLSIIAFGNEEDDRLLKSLVYIEMRNVPFQQQLQILYFCLDNLPRFYSGSIDARGNGQMIAEYTAQRYGEAYIQMVMISRPFYMEYMPKYKARLEDNEMTLPEDPNIVDDHRVVVLNKGVPVIAERTSDIGDKSKKRHGDSVIGGVLMVHAYENDENDYSPYEYEAVGNGNRWRNDEDDDW